MLQKYKLYIYIVLLAVLIAGAYFAYNYLAEEYNPGYELNESATTFSDAGTVSKTANGTERSEDITASDVKPVTKATYGTEKAADFTVYDGDGNEVKLSDMYGKPVIINFWATWCGPCRSELPHFEKLYGEYGDKITFMMVDLTDGNHETKKSVKSFIAENGYTFPVYFDTGFSASDAYKISSIPLTVTIYPDGTIAQKHIGSMSENALRALISSIC